MEKNICLPGKLVYDFDDLGEDAVKFGPGLMQNKNRVIAVKGGELMHNKLRNIYWINSDQKRYVPSVGERVIGIVVQKMSDTFKVDIGAAHYAFLSQMAFENSSKRNKTNLNVGDVVYAKVTVASKDMDPEIECYNNQTLKSEGLGELKGGFLIHCSLGVCRTLITANNPISAILESNFEYEIAHGLNGRIWIKTKLIQHTILIKDLILNIISPEQLKEKLRY